jgi:hypothetical protein
MKRNPQRFSEVTLYVIDTDTSDRQAKARHCLPLVIGSDGWTVGSGLYGVAMMILLDYFEDEIDCERRAAKNQPQNEVAQGAPRPPRR